MIDLAINLLLKLKERVMRKKRLQRGKRVWSGRSRESYPITMGARSIEEQEPWHLQDEMSQ
jgi:hypothetical protein